MGWQLLSVGVFYSLILLVGLFAAGRRSEDGTTSGLLLANRGLPLWIGVFTMVATWVGGGYINGTAEAVYDSQRGLVWTMAPWGYALSMAVGGLFFARRMRRMNFTTLLDPFEIRYGKRVAAALFLPALVGEVFWSAAILVALGTTFGTVLGFDVSASILFSAAVAVGYTMVGGLRSVAYTDVVQLVCLVLGLCIAIPFAIRNVGGAEAVMTGYLAEMTPFPSGTGVWLWFDMALLLILGGIPWQVYFQRVLASKDEQTAMRLSLIGAVGCLLMAIPAVILGAVGAVADWGPTGVDPSEQPAMILPYVLRHLTPPVVATVGLGAVAAAVMSSVDSSILSASSMFAWNVYRPLVRTSASDRELRYVVRIAILVVGLAATGLALSVQSVYVLWYLCADLVYVVLFPQLVMVLFNRHANRTGAITGALMGLLLRLGGGEPMIGLPAFIPYPWQGPSGSDFPFRTFAMLTGLLTIWLVSRVTGKIDPPQPLAETGKQDCSPSAE
ncbi:MAG: sodium:solute symporter family protein [Rubripirellula sp.]|nr:sodium:solute symporter family protein [Rubripirellula sp.]